MEISKQILLLIFIILFSCKQESHKVDTNLLDINRAGDSIENGLWVFETNKFGVQSQGKFKDGLRSGKWTYSVGKDSTSVNWNTLKIADAKFSFPDKYKIIQQEKLNYPVIFQADIIDDDVNTFIGLLKHDLDDSYLRGYEYLLFCKEELTKDSNVKILFLKANKYIFKNIEIYKMQIDLDDSSNYSIISYVFVINDKLFELVYKNKTSRVSKIELEIFENILYSLECDGVDLFNYSSRQYLKQEEIIFK